MLYNLVNSIKCKNQWHDHFFVETVIFWMYQAVNLRIASSCCVARELTTTRHGEITHSHEDYTCRLHWLGAIQFHCSPPPHQCQDTGDRRISMRGPELRSGGDQTPRTEAPWPNSIMIILFSLLLQLIQTSCSLDWVPATSQHWPSRIQRNQPFING